MKNVPLLNFLSFKPQKIAIFFLLKPIVLLSIGAILFATTSKRTQFHSEEVLK
jgi:hypothetical protein